MLDEAKRYTLAYGFGFEAQRLGSSPTSTTLDFAPRGIIELTKANFTGRADSLSFKVRASTIQGRGQVAYTAPNFFASPHFTFQLTGYFEKARDIQTFTAKRYEGQLQLSEKVTSASTLFYRYSYRRVLATNLNIAADEIPLFSQPTEVSSEFDVRAIFARSPQQPRGRHPGSDLKKASTSAWP